MTTPSVPIAIVASTGVRARGATAARTAASRAASSNTATVGIEVPSIACRSWIGEPIGEGASRPLAIAASTTASTSTCRPMSANGIVRSPSGVRSTTWPVP